MSTAYRIWQIVPSSNMTMETEIPTMLHARETTFPEQHFDLPVAQISNCTGGQMPLAPGLETVALGSGAALSRRS